MENPGLHLALGPNSADIKGELGVKDLNLDATIDAHLDNALPGLGGTAKGLVKVRGTVDAPQLLADITARALRWQELTIAQVNVKGDVKSTDQIGGNLTCGLIASASRGSISAWCSSMPKAPKSSMSCGCGCRAIRCPAS